jgi:integrase
MPRRRTRGEGSIYEKPKGSGIYYAEVVLADGRQSRRKGPTAKEARERLKELNALKAAGVLGNKQPTLAQWWALWLEHFASNLKANIKDDYRSIGARYVDGKPIGKKRLIDLTAAEVQAWVNALGARGLATQTVRNAHARLRTALKAAQRHGYIERNVAIGIKLPAAADDEGDEAPAQQVWPFDTAMTYLELLQHNRWLALYRLAINLGLRQAELIGLTWDMVDIERGTLKINQQLRRVRDGEAKAWRLMPVKTKAGKRTLKLDADLVEVLRAHKVNQAEERLLHGKAFQERDPWYKSRAGLVFVTETGAPIHGSDLLQHFRRWTKKAELSPIRFHDLRHTAATLMLESGYPIPSVSKILGHANPSITMRIYAHALEDSKAETIAGLSRRLRRG